MQPLHFQSATQIARQIATGTLTARQALEHFLDRVDRLNPSINAVIVQDRPAARARADAADARQASGQALGPLHGVPMTVKESFDLAGHPSTWGMVDRRQHVAAADALAVQRLAAAGANVFGKTNVPVALADFQSYNPVYGATDNPWRQGLTPGGSSGGSAAALAAGLTGLEIGSDIGGSIRNPAHFCGVFGHKGTWDLMPGRGHGLDGGHTSTDIAVIGPLARSAHDLEIALQLMAPPDVMAARALKLDLKPLHEPTGQLRIAVWRDDALCPVSQAVRDRVDAVAAALAGQGAQVDDAARPAFSAEDSHNTYLTLLHSAMAARVGDAEFAVLLAKAAALAPGDASLAARILRAQTLRARDWQQVNAVRTGLRWAWHEFFEQFDFMLMPVMSTTAFAHDHGPFGKRLIGVDGVPQPYFNQVFWAGLAGVAYLPSTVIPAGNGPDGLPIGVQIVGPSGGDLRTIGLAQRLEALGFGFTPPPGW